MRRARHAAAISRSFPLGPAIVTRKALLVLITSNAPARGTLSATAVPARPPALGCRGQAEAGRRHAAWQSIFLRWSFLGFPCA